MPRDSLLSPAAARGGDSFLVELTRLEAAIDDFLAALESQRRAKKTLEAYGRALGRFARFCGDVPPDRLTAQLVRRWQRSLAVEGLTATTQSDYLRPVKTWLRWLAGEGGYGVDETIVARVKAPHHDSEQPYPFTDEEIAKLFKACNRNGWLGQRMRAMMAVLFDTGIRASELCGLRLADVDLKAGEILVRAATSKTRKDRTIALGSRGKSEAGRWWFRQRSAWTQHPDAAFFCTGKEKAMGQKALTKLISRHGQLAGVPHTHPHRFRHTMAVNSLKAGMSPSVLMATLGHRSFTMTQRYIRLAEADVTLAKRAASWLDSAKL